MRVAVDRGLPKALASVLPDVGTSANFRGAVPVFCGWSAISEGLDTSVLDRFPVLWLFRCDLQTLRAAKLHMWEGLDAAAVGIGRWLGVSVVVYDRAAALAAVDASVTDLPDTCEEQVVLSRVAHQIVDEQVLLTDIGDSTPFFLL